MSGQIDISKDSYADKLTKLLPAEGIAAMTAIKSLFPPDTSYLPWLEGAAVVVAIFVFFWAFKARRVANPLQLLFIMLAYGLWVISILWDLLTGRYAIAQNAPQALPAVASILFALFIPMVFPSASGNQVPANAPPGGG